MATGNNSIRTGLLVFALMSFIFAGCGGSYTQEIVEEHPDGSTKTIQYYKENDEGKSIYKLEEFHDNGVKRVEGFFENDERHGRWNSWFPNGKLWSTAHYREGALHGKQTVYHPSGEKYYEGTFEKGIRTGEWKFWDERGQLVSKKTY
jgi:antitoxin component YwqK of YwqJK toxin-antitoxin module